MKLILNNLSSASRGQELKEVVVTLKREYRDLKKRSSKDESRVRTSKTLIKAVIRLTHSFKAYKVFAEEERRDVKAAGTIAFSYSG